VIEVNLIKMKLPAFFEVHRSSFSEPSATEGSTWRQTAEMKIIGQHHGRRRSHYLFSSFEPQLPSACEHHQDYILTEKLNAVQGHPLECR